MADIVGIAIAMPPSSNGGHGRIRRRDGRRRGDVMMRSPRRAGARCQTTPHVYAELAAEAVSGIDGAFLAVDHEGSRHLLLSVDSDIEPVTDERSRGIRALTRPLSVQGQPERHFVECSARRSAARMSSTSSRPRSSHRSSRARSAPDAVRNTLARWRRFWGAAPVGGLTGEEIRGLFGELWFLAVWLLPHGQARLPIGSARRGPSRLSMAGPRVGGQGHRIGPRSYPSHQRTRPARTAR